MQARGAAAGSSCRCGSRCSLMRGNDASRECSSKEGSLFPFLFSSGMWASFPVAGPHGGAEHGGACACLGDCHRGGRGGSCLSVERRRENHLYQRHGGGPEGHPGQYGSAESRRRVRGRGSGKGGAESFGCRGDEKRGKGDPFLEE